MKYLILKDHEPWLFSDKERHDEIAYNHNDLAYGEGNDIVAGGSVELVVSDDLFINARVSGEAEGIKGITSRPEDGALIEKLLNNIK